LKACQGTTGRVFIMRLEHGDIIPDCIERFAAEKKITYAQVALIGDVEKGEIVVGPRRSELTKPEPMLLPLEGVHEAVGFGILVPLSDGAPRLHIHAAMGRAGQTITGCLRHGVAAWLVGEAILTEITGIDAIRKWDEQSGFNLLTIGNSQQ
jgi:predicted DNA-binding protein with PD1-like motif